VFAHVGKARETKPVRRRPVARVPGRTVTTSSRSPAGGVATKAAGTAFSSVKRGLLKAFGGTAGTFVGVLPIAGGLVLVVIAAFFLHRYRFRSAWRRRARDLRARSSRGAAPDAEVTS
jgi:hypothetical protein